MDPVREPLRRAARTLTVPFGVVAAARGSRAVHPQGFLCRGTWTIDRTLPVAVGVPLLRAGAWCEVIARPSRGVGLPESVGDFFAIAIRLVDAHGEGLPQDLLVNSSADVPVVHHVFLPAPRWYAQSYSTCLPYRTPDGIALVGLLPPDTPGPGPSLDAMRAVVRDGVTFGIALATPLGRWKRIGDLRMHGVIEAAVGDMDFDPPANTGGGLTPAPAWLQAVRSEAYRWSRRGRRAPEEPRVRPGPGRDG